MTDYKKKYEKYKKKYEKLKKRLQKEEEDDDDDEEKKWDELEKLLQKTPVLTIDITLQSLKICEKIPSIEGCHMLEDKLKQKFLRNIAENKITDMDIIKEISKLLTDMGDLPYEKWYA